MQIFASKKCLPLGRIVTYFSLAMLAVSLILLLTGGSRAANNNIEVTLHTDETKDYERTPEEGYSSLEKQEPAEVVAEQSCNYANVHCAQGEMGLTAKVNSLLTALVAFNKQGAEQKEAYVYNNKKTLFGFVTRAITSTYTPPASGAYYVADAIDHIGISRTAYAQGFGYYGLQPFLVTWKVMRNFVYVAFSIVIIGVAISVLMRQSFSSNNAVTVQQILPNIIITLIAITFSYAIAGFLIDLMYWIMYAVGSFIQVNTGHTTSGDGGAFVNAGNGGVDYILNQSIWGVFTSAMSAGFTNTYSGVSTMIQGLFNSGFWSGVGGKIVGAISGGLAALVMVVIVLVNVFKLFFILAKSYVFVVLYTVFSPFILAMQVFKPGTFRRWVLSIAANLSPFALTFFMLVFLGICNAVFQKSSANGWVPPFMFGGQTDSYAVGSVVVIGMILAMNEIITEIKKKIGGEGGFFEKIGGAAMANAEKGGLTKAATLPGRLAINAGKAGVGFGKDYLQAQAGAYLMGRVTRKHTKGDKEAKDRAAGIARKTYLDEQRPKRIYRAQDTILSTFGLSDTWKEVYDPKDRAKHANYLSVAQTNMSSISSNSTDPDEKKLRRYSHDWITRYHRYQNWVNAERPGIQSYVTLVR